MFCFSSGLFSSAVRIAHNSVTILHNIINLLFLFSLSNPRSIFQNNFVLLLPYCRKFSRQLNFAILKGNILQHFILENLISLPHILRHKLLKHPLTQQICTVVFRGKICNTAIFKDFYKNHEAQHAKNTFENCFLIPLRFT